MDNTTTSANNKYPADSEKKKLIEQFVKDKTSAVKARQIRIQNWIESEKSYNGQPTMTLLTRSNLHLPKVFEAVQTMSSRLGDIPDMEFNTKPEGDDNADEMMSAIWLEDVDASGGEELIQSSKVEAAIYGRGIMKIIPSNKGNRFEIVDTMAFLINPTARSHKDMLYGGQQFIYKTIDQIESDADEMKYDADEVKRLKDDKVASETAGNFSQEKSLKDLRLSYMGYANVTQLGSKLVELNEWFTYIEGKPHMMTVANDVYLLRCIPLKDLGLPRSPFVTWGTYPRSVAFWTPSVADIMRDPNLAMDVSLNQLIDNSTYRNFGMMFVDSASGLKQSSIVPRPLGVTPVTVGNGKTVKDSIWQFTPPEISDAASTIQTIGQIAENAIGLSATPMGHKGKMSVTQLAQSSALVETKTNSMKKNFVAAWRELAQLSAECITMNLTTPRKIKIFSEAQLTIEDVTKKNFAEVEFMVRATPQESSNDNKAIKQKAKQVLFEMFKDDPKVPGQQKLRRIVAKEFGLTITELGDLFTADATDPMAGAQPVPGQVPGMPPGAPQIPANPENPQLSANGAVAAAAVPPAIR